MQDQLWLLKEALSLDASLPLLLKRLRANPPQYAAWPQSPYQHDRFSQTDTVNSLDQSLRA